MLVTSHVCAGNNWTQTLGSQLLINVIYQWKSIYVLLITANIHLCLQCWTGSQGHTHTHTHARAKQVLTTGLTSPQPEQTSVD